MRKTVLDLGSTSGVWLWRISVGQLPLQLLIPQFSTTISAAKLVDNSFSTFSCNDSPIHPILTSISQYCWTDTQSAHCRYLHWSLHRLCPHPDPDSLLGRGRQSSMRKTSCLLCYNKVQPEREFAVQVFYEADHLRYLVQLSWVVIITRDQEYILLECILKWL